MFVKKFIITVGLPASGKTYWVNQTFGKDKTAYNSNRDDLRMELFNRYDIKPQQEKIITKVQEERVLDAINKYDTIIISDTNLNKDTYNRWLSFAKKNAPDYILEIKSFTDLYIGDCIKQDLKRDKSVGKDVIVNKYIQYIRPHLYKHNNQKPNTEKSIMIDIDGTIAIKGDRRIYEWEKVSCDIPNIPIINLIRLYSKANYKLIFCSGRHDCCYVDTKRWIVESFYYRIIKTTWDEDGIDIMFDELTNKGNLFMRKTGDMRKDYIVKREIFMEHIDQQYNVEAAFDDREQVVRLWRNLGLICLQVNDGLF